MSIFGAYVEPPSPYRVGRRVRLVSVEPFPQETHRWPALGTVGTIVALPEPGVLGAAYEVEWPDGTRFWVGMGVTMELVP